MDLMKAGGKGLVVLTVGLAVIDQLLPLLIIGTVVGVFVSKRAHQCAKQTSDKQAERGLKEIEKWATADRDKKGKLLAKEEKDERKQKAKALITQLEKKTKLDERGNATLAQIMGIGAFADPLAGLAYAALGAGLPSPLDHSGKKKKKKQKVYYL
jgi:hypothetical protein